MTGMDISKNGSALIERLVEMKKFIAVRRGSEIQQADLREQPISSSILSCKPGASGMTGR